MRGFFKSLTLKKVLSILAGAIFIFLGLVWSTYLYQQITNSSYILENMFLSHAPIYQHLILEVHSHENEIHIHTVGDTTKPSIVILPGRGSGIYKRRYMFRDTDILDTYSLIFVDQTKLPSHISNKDIAKTLSTYIQGLGLPVSLMASGGGTYTALHMLDQNQQTLEKAVLVSGFYNTLIDTSTKTEKKYMKYLRGPMSSNFKKAWAERLDIEKNINPLLQRLSAKIDTPLLILHGSYNLSLNASHATYLEEVLRISNSTLLTDTKQLRLKKHSKLIYGTIDGFLE